MPTANSTGLVQNTDFSAELLLNKVMNKQYKTQNGNTLTLSGRMNASSLDAQAQSYGVQAENIAKAQTLANATQDALTEMVAIAKKAQEANTMSDTAEMQKLGKELKNRFDGILNTTIDSVSVLTSNKVVDLGLGSGSVSVGLGGSTNGLKSLSDALAKISAGSAADASTLSAAVNEIYGSIATEGAKAEILNNRYDALNDLASTYKTASDNQVVTEGGSATSLLNSLL